MPDSNTPIIIVKKVKGHGGHHGGAWKVAFADFVTALMALFIVLWLLSSSQKVQKAVGGYFKDPKGAGRMVGTNRSGSGQGLELKSDDMNQLKDRVRKAMEREVKEFSKVENQVDIIVTEEGLRVELVENEQGTFFDTGRATPTASGANILGSLAEEVAKLPNKVMIEGHTDSRPYNESAEYTNWELSTDRANAARRLMQRRGLRPDQVTQVRGFADQHLRKQEAPEDASNRRVSIIVRYLSGEKTS